MDKKDINWGVWSIGMALLIAFILSLVSCSHLTVYPKAVVAREIAFDKNTQNAGLIDCDKTGCLVSRSWLNRYRALETEFKQTTPADRFIRPEGENYRVSFEVTNHFIELQRSHRSSP